VGLALLRFMGQAYVLYDLCCMISRPRANSSFPGGDPVIRKMSGSMTTSFLISTARRVKSNLHHVPQSRGCLCDTRALAKSFFIPFGMSTRTFNGSIVSSVLVIPQ
jgi:hypothetical protein